MKEFENIQIAVAENGYIVNRTQGYYGANKAYVFREWDDVIFDLKRKPPTEVVIDDEPAEAETTQETPANG